MGHRTHSRGGEGTGEVVRLLHDISESKSYQRLKLWMTCCSHSRYLFYSLSFRPPPTPQSSSTARKPRSVQQLTEGCRLPEASWEEPSTMGVNGLVLLFLLQLLQISYRHHLHTARRAAGWHLTIGGPTARCFPSAKLWPQDLRIGLLAGHHRGRPHHWHFQPVFQAHQLGWGSGSIQLLIHWFCIWCWVFFCGHLLRGAHDEIVTKQQFRTGLCILFIFTLEIQVRHKELLWALSFWLLDKGKKREHWKDAEQSHPRQEYYH